MPSSPSVQCGGPKGSVRRYGQLRCSFVRLSFRYGCAPRNKPAINIGEHKQDHASQNQWNKDSIEQVDEEYKWEYSRAWLVVAEPGVCETGRRGIRVTLLTLNQQVFLERDACVRIGYPHNIVNAMA